MDIIVNKVDEVYVHLTCEEAIKAELTEFFSFYAPNYQFNPLYKRKVWNGKIYLYNRKNSYLNGGLLRYLKDFCEKRKLKVQIHSSLNTFNDFSSEEATNFIEILDLHSRNKPIEPRDYQLTGFLKAIKYRRLLLLSPTASGKSLIIYLIVRYLLNMECKRGLLIVPTISLVEQMYEDFKDYSSKNNWNVNKLVQKIYQGQDKSIGRKFKVHCGKKSFILLGNQSIKTLNRGMVLVEDLKEGDDIDESSI